MPRIHLASASLFALASLSPAASAQDDSALTDIITVSGAAPLTGTTDDISPAQTAPSSPDATELVARLPGAAAISNGALSGQVQYRGLFGPRMNVRIDGQRFESGGPNLMDPPLQYAPLALVDRIEVDRGVSPVRHGPGLAGGMNAVFKQVGFADSGPTGLLHDVAVQYRSADAGTATGGVLGAATETFRLNALFSHEEGENLDTPLGTIGGSAFERQVYGIAAGLREDGHEFSLDLRRHETGATGNPPFAMDIRYIDADFVQARYAGEFGDLSFAAHAGYSDIAHAMNNFDLRPAPASPMMWRETLAYGLSRTAGVEASFDAFGGTLRLGVDHDTVDHDVTITNPNNAGFVLHNLPQIELTRTGLFAEWTGLIAGWQAELGLRGDDHTASAGLASAGSAVPAMPAMLASSFNAGDRDWSDTTVDAVARLWRPIDDTLTARLTLARKTRVPTYLERFAWLPTPASGGLADGNTYVGDRHLGAETAWIGEAGIDWQTQTAYLRPTLFYRQVDDYIQGVPFDASVGIIDTPVEMVSAMNGDPTPLRFANVDARLYGLDLDFGYALNAAWRLDGVASWVAGERRDVDDHLYRVTPPSLRLGLSRDAVRWSATLETLAVAEQDDVSMSNGEASTPGYVIANLSGRFTLNDNVELSAGVENILDHGYRRHLAGYNRNQGSEIAIGARLPGTGRSFGIRVHVRR